MIRLLIFLGLAVAIGCDGRAEAPAAREPVYLFVASSLSDAVAEIASEVERVHPRIDVLLNVGGSTLLRRQIELADRADLFFSASVEEMQDLVARGLVDAAGWRTPIANELVVVSGERMAPGPASTGRSPGRETDLAARFASASRIAVGQPDTVPAGRYAKQWLQRIDLWNEIEAKLLPTPNVRAAVAAVRSGGAELGIVYGTDAERFDDLVVLHRVAALDRDAPNIRYALGLLRDRSELAEIVFEALVADSAREVYRRHGFLVLDQTGEPDATPTTDEPRDSQSG